MNKSSVLKNISKKEKIGAIIWLVLATIQILLGIIFIEYYWVTLIIGVWNLINGIIRITRAEKIEERKDTLVEEYEKNLVNLIIFLIVNIFVGGLIGVIGVIYDFITRNYVLSNKDIILGNVSANYSSSNNKYEDLEKLMKLKEQGILTDEEFKKEKTKIMGG